MFKIMIVGDLHTEFKRLNVIINKHNPDVVLCCGDFGYWNRCTFQEGVGMYIEDIKPKNTKIYFCDGNHEDHVKLNMLQEDNGIKPIEVVHNVFYCPRGTVINFPILGNTLFMGGAESQDKEQRKIMVDWFPQETITQTDFYNIPEGISLDTIISHTCPDFSVHCMEGLDKRRIKKLKDPSCVCLTAIFDTYKPTKWFFGHFHMYEWFYVNNTKFTCLDYPGHGGQWFTVLKESD